MPEASEVPRQLSSADAIKRMERAMYKDAMMRDADLKRGSKLPPISIEPFPFERQRLSGGYTDADRALRKQWLSDQLLTEREPVHVEKLYRRNWFRRMWNGPFDALNRGLVGLGVPKSVASFVRYLSPKLVGGLTFTYALWFHMKFSGLSWERQSGGYAYQSTAACGPAVPGSESWKRLVDDGWLHRAPETFYNRGFDNRSVFRGDKLVTSAPGQQVNGQFN